MNFINQNYFIISINLTIFNHNITLKSTTKTILMKSIPPVQPLINNKNLNFLKIQQLTKKIWKIIYNLKSAITNNLNLKLKEINMVTQTQFHMLPVGQDHLKIYMMKLSGQSSLHIQIKLLLKMLLNILERHILNIQIFRAYLIKV